jgi:hypothetical protein
VSDSRDQIDDAVANARRMRGPLLAATVVSLPLGGVALHWALDKPSDARGLIAAFAGTTILVLTMLVGFSWYGSNRARYLRFLRWSRRFGSSMYHDPSPTRVCPRCGLPMDRVMGGAFYTGPASPRELCHRCLHTDSWPAPDIPDE